jgi:hypothetical protein
MTYNNFKELYDKYRAGEYLQQHDTLQFGELTYNCYNCCTCFLEVHGGNVNSEIFNTLKCINIKDDIATNVYGYKSYSSNSNCFPQCKPLDTKALTKIALFIFRCLEYNVTGETALKLSKNYTNHLIETNTGHYPMSYDKFKIIAK